MSNRVSLGLSASGASVAIAVGLAAGTAHAAFTFDDIDYWVGSGANEAALVIDWTVGTDTVSLAWGYRWDGAATGQDMLSAVINADGNLYGRFASFGFGDAVIGLGYDVDGDGFAISDGTDFGLTGLAFAGTSDGATATDTGDAYNEGWNTGFWAYSLGSGDPFDGGSWTNASVGFSGRSLSDGDWDGYRFAPGFVSDTPREPVSAAIPSAPVLAPMVAWTLISSRRRRG